MDALAATGRVRVCDLKAHYVGTPVDTVPDADFHRLIAERFPDAVLEDASLAADVLDALDGALDRLSFDAPIHSLADVDALPVRDPAPQHQAVALRAALRVSSSASTPASSAASSCTAAASSSSASGAARSRRSRASSTRARRTTSRRPSYNAPEPVARAAAEPTRASAPPGGLRLVIAVALAAVALVAAPPKPPIVQRPIPFGPQRRAEMAAYSERHYGTAQWRLIAPKVIVEHYTASDTFASAYNTFAPDHPDPELHELPNVCAHFVVDTDGTIFQLVPLTIRCRHTVGLNDTAIGIEHVGRSATGVLSNGRQISASLALTRWLMFALPHRAAQRDRSRREPLEPLSPRARAGPADADPQRLERARDAALPGAARASLKTRFKCLKSVRKARRPRCHRAPRPTAARCRRVS